MNVNNKIFKGVSENVNSVIQNSIVMLSEAKYLYSGTYRFFVEFILSKANVLHYVLNHNKYCNN